MDPNACLIAILEAIAARDTEEARDRMEDLADWINKGGVVPEAIHAALDALRFA